MLDQPYMTDLIEANSMGHEPNLIDIYSASWGPTDDGKTVDGPRNATMRAIVRGVNEVGKFILQIMTIMTPKYVPSGKILCFSSNNCTISRKFIVICNLTCNFIKHCSIHRYIKKGTKC